MVKVYKGVRRPKPFLMLFAGYDISRMFQEHGENPKRLVLQPDLVPRPIHLASAKMHFVGVKAHHIRGLTARPAVSGSRHALGTSGRSRRPRRASETSLAGGHLCRL